MHSVSALPPPSGKQRESEMSKQNYEIHKVGENGLIKTWTKG